MKRNVLFLFLLFFCKSLFSQTDTLNEEIKIDEIVISATKFEEHKRNIAQNIQVLSIRDIKHANTQNTADLLANTTNISVQKSQMGGGSTVIRGFEASRVLYIVDGVRLNNLIYRAGHLQSIITIDQSILDKIEILYGPTSTAYGSDALGGVIHLQTKNPRLADSTNQKIFNLNVSSRYASANKEKNAHLDFNLANDKISWLASFTASDFEDLRMGANKNFFYDTLYWTRDYYVENINLKDSIIENKNNLIQKYSGYYQYDILQKILIKQSSNIKHIFNFQLSNSSDIPRYDRLTDLSKGDLKFAEWYYGPQQRTLSSYEITTSNILNVDNIRLLINYQTVKESRHQRTRNSNNLQNRYENVKLGGINVDVNKLFYKHELRLGAEAYYNNLISTANEIDITTNEISKLDTRYPNGQNYMFDIATYIVHTYKTTKKIVINDGIRVGYSKMYSSFATKDFFDFPFDEIQQQQPIYSANIGLIFLPNKNSKYVINTATGYRVPNIDDLSKIFDSSPGNLIIPNQNIKPEKTLNLDLAAANILFDRLLMENTVYTTYYYDAIITDFFSYNGEDSIFYQGEMSRVLANQNKRKAIIMGASSDIKLFLFDKILIKTSLNYTRGRIITDSILSPLDHIPPLSVKILLKMSNKKTTYQLFAHYNAWKKIADYYLNGEDNERYATPDGMPAWLSINFNFGYQMTKNFSVQTGVHNILDTQYRVFASGINAAGRNFFVTLRYSYF